jgi:hypothetical protein
VGITVLIRIAPGWGVLAGALVLLGFMVRAAIYRPHWRRRAALALRER